MSTPIELLAPSPTPAQGSLAVVVRAPEKEKASVRISRQLSRSEAWDSLTKTKGLRGFMMLAQTSGGTLAAGEIYEASIESVRDILNCRDDRLLKEELEGMSGLKINWNRLDADKHGYTVPVPDCVISDGRVRFAFSPMFAKTFLETGRGFQYISWEVYVSFLSVYTIKLYEFLALYKPGKDSKEIPQPVPMSTIDMRKLLGVKDTQYCGTNQGDLFRKIDKSIKEINDAQDGFFVAYERKGRGPAMLHTFRIAPAPKQERLPVPSKCVAMSVRDSVIRDTIVKIINGSDFPADLKTRIQSYLSMNTPTAYSVAKGMLMDDGFWPSDLNL